MRTTVTLLSNTPVATVRRGGAGVVLMLASLTACAQETPLISGGMGFFSSTNGGNTTYLPIIEPLIVLPIGPRFQIESRAAILESFFPVTGNGYNTSHFAALTYLQGRAGE